MRTPVRKVRDDGQISYKVRFRLNGRDTSTTFIGPATAERDLREAAAKFSGLVTTLGPAEALAWQQRHDSGEPADDRRETPTLNEWAATYIAGRTAVTDGTRHGYERTHALYYGPLLGDVPIGDLDRGQIAAALNELRTTRGRHGKGYSDKTIANAHGLLASMLKEAQADGVIAANPSARIKLGRSTSHQRAEMVLMSDTDFVRLLGEIPAHYRPLVLTLFGTGMRWGEVEALEVRDVNVKARTLRVNKAAKWDTRLAQRTVGPTKTKNSDRTVTIDDHVLAALLPLTVGRPRNARLFVAPRGGPLRHKSFWAEAWVPACERAGLDDPRPRIHDARHTHASWLIERGVNLYVVSARLGHHSIKVTVDTYGHLSNEAQRAAADAAAMVFTSALGPAPGSDDGPAELDPGDDS